VATIRRWWWQAMGARTCPGADRLLDCADGFGYLDIWDDGEGTWCRSPATGRRPRRTSNSRSDPGRLRDAHWCRRTAPPPRTRLLPQRVEVPVQTGVIGCFWASQTCSVVGCNVLEPRCWLRTER